VATQASISRSERLETTSICCVETLCQLHPYSLPQIIALVQRHHNSSKRFVVEGHSRRGRGCCPASHQARTSSCHRINFHPGPVSWDLPQSDEPSFDTNDHDDEVVPRVMIMLRLRFWRGFSGYHQSLALQNSILEDVMEVVDCAEEQENFNHER